MIKMFIKFIVALVGLGAVLGIIVAIKGKQFAPQAMPEFPPETVTTAVAEKQVWETTLGAIGSLEANRGIHLAGELGGTIRELHFEAGQRVKAGDLLVSMDTSVEEAQLAAARATAELAALNLRRSRDLKASNTISEAEFDAAEARAKEAEAQVKALEATIALKTLRAPFAGFLGIEQVDEGAFVSPGAPIVSLVETDPVVARFSLPQVHLRRLEVGMTVYVTTDAFADEVFEGRIDALEAEVNEVNRSIAIEALVPNPDGRLRPGMFARIDVVMPEKREVIAVPQMSVYRQSFGNSIFAFVPAPEGAQGHVAEQRFVRMGERKGDYISILEGVKEGEKVVSSGVFKLSTGRAVVENNAKAPNPQLKPTPEDS